MDIYKYVQSASVKNYWQGINFVPDSLASAFLISYYSLPDITLNEKWKDYKAIYESGQSTYILPYDWYKYNCTLEKFLKLLIKTEKAVLKRFYDNSFNGGFYLANVASGAFEELVKGGYYISLDDLEKEWGNKDFYYMDVTRHYSNGEKITVRFNNVFQATSILGGSGTKEEDQIICGVLSSFYFDFPLPFSFGDKVYGIVPQLGPKKPFTITKLPRMCRDDEAHDDFLDNLEDMSLTGIDEENNPIITLAIDVEYAVA